LAGYFIDRDTGALTAVSGSPVALGATPTSVAVAPSGKFVYVTTRSNGIVGFAVQSNGSLVKIAGSPFPTQELPTTVVVSAAGNYVYVADWSGGTVDAYSINSVNGALTPVPGEPYSPPNGECGGCTDGGAPFTLTTDRNGNFLIVPGFEGGGVNVYKIDHADGSLSLVPGSPFISRIVHPEEIGPEPYSVTVDADNRFVYLYEQHDADIAVFSLNPTTGQLELLTHNFVAQQCGGDEIVADPSGSFVYGTTDGTFCVGIPQGIFGLSINQSSGDVTKIPGSPFPTPEAGIQVDGIAVTP
jgi:6-phosphogluconolactonase (cycloisomerase 2 family)